MMDAVPEADVVIHFADATQPIGKVPGDQTAWAAGSDNEERDIDLEPIELNDASEATEEESLPSKRGNSV